MSFLFDRACTVTVYPPPSTNYVETRGFAIKVTDLRVRFRIIKTNKAHPNAAEIQITNLSRDTRSQMQAKGSYVVVEAGYTDTLSQIFAGDVRTIDHVKEGADWVTKIRCGDGERAYLNARVNTSFAGGTAIATVLKSITKAMGINQGNLVDQIANLSNQYANGYTASGKASVELDRVLSSVNLSWSIQDGRLEVLPPLTPNKNETVTLTPTSGLVGSPEHGTPNKKGKPSVLKAKCLIQPSLKVNGRVFVSCENTNGTFRISKVTHDGDTTGGPWYTEIEGLPTSL